MEESEVRREPEGCGWMATTGPLFTALSPRGHPAPGQSPTDMGGTLPPMLSLHLGFVSVSDEMSPSAPDLPCGTMLNLYPMAALLE